MSIEKNQSLAAKVRILGVHAAKDLEGTKADGILGLSPTELIPETSFVT